MQNDNRYLKNEEFRASQKIQHYEDLMPIYSVNMSFYPAFPYNVSHLLTLPKDKIELWIKVKTITLLYILQNIICQLTTKLLSLQ